MKPKYFCVFLLLVLLSACGQSSTPAPFVHHGRTNAAGSAGVHTVRAGDTAWSISKRYEIPLRDLLDRNRLGPPYNLELGQRLYLPPPETYTVRTGDSLFSISQQFDVGVSEMARINNIPAPYRIYPDEKLKLPYTGRFASQSYAAPTGKSVQSKAVPVKTVTSSKAATKPPTQLNKVAIPKTTPARSSNRFAWPVQGKILSSYGPKTGGLHNDGINIESPRGAPVRAGDNGVVVYTGDAIKGYGNLILVRHSEQWMTAYAHLDKFLVKKGATIRRGQTIGTVGSSGQVDKPQLHFEVRKGKKVFNPIYQLEKAGS